MLTCFLHCGVVCNGTMYDVSRAAKYPTLPRPGDRIEPGISKLTTVNGVCFFDGGISIDLGRHHLSQDEFDEIDRDLWDVTPDGGYAHIPASFSGFACLVYGEITCGDEVFQIEREFTFLHLPRIGDQITSNLGTLEVHWVVFKEDEIPRLYIKDMENEDNLNLAEVKHLGWLQSQTKRTYQGYRLTGANA